MRQNIKFAAAIAACAVALTLLLLMHNHETQAQPVPGQSLLNPQRIIDTTGANTNGPWTNRILGSGQAAPANLRVDARAFRDMSFEYSFEAAAANSGLQTVFFGRNNSGLLGNTNMEQFATLTATANGTAHITVCTNFGGAGLGGGYAYYYVMAISNGGVGFITNYTVTTGGK